MNAVLGNASQFIHRKGARRCADVPAEVLDRLNRGELATKTLAESLVIDFRILLTHAAPHHTFPDAATDLSFATGFMQRNRTAGTYLAAALGRHVVKELGNHVSDVVRGWVALAIGFLPHLTLKSCLRQMRRFANDPHFAVREYAWMAARPHLAKNLESSFRLLLPWAQHQEVNIRRFAIEVLRPRGVWCMHIDVLKEQPEIAEALLGVVNSDRSRYVQDSVANWLNDAAKTRPDWVEGLCDRWLVESPTKETQRICRRAQRSIW